MTNTTTTSAATAMTFINLICFNVLLGSARTEAFSRSTWYFGPSNCHRLT